MSPRERQRHRPESSGSARRARQTLQLGLATFAGARHTEWSALMAGNVVAVLPLVAAFVLAQRHFVATMSFSGLKG
ncbi:hypothetical protein [Nonomuraea sp. CA-141351]|uniref:hypothetical protein n=1 Tax=Nonomuraea sp. CA-141351 TaxID=3239996 RepID=UPI003D8F6462